MAIVDKIEIFAPTVKPIVSLSNFTLEDEPLSLFYIEQDLSWQLGAKTIPLGKIRLYSSSNVVIDRLLLGFSLIAMTAVIKIMALAFLFLWRFKRFLGRPLQRLTSQVDEIQLDKIGQKRIDLWVEDNNELRHLQEQINLMLSKIEHDSQTMLKTEKEGRHLLEQEVELRTPELVKSNQQLEEMASIDYVTRIHHRRSFFEKAQILFDLTIRQRQPLCMLALDIGHFKLVNDTYGHSVGDLALGHFSQLIETLLRQSDLFGRVGGEEFGILLPDTDMSGAHHLAEKLCALIHDTPMIVDKDIIHMRVSIGLVECLQDEVEIATIFKRADTCLYRPKDKGRNRVEI